jgi:transposase
MAFAAAATHSRDLTDEQWDLIGRLLPEPVRRADGRGRPWRKNRAVLNGILWILRIGAPWADLPGRYPSDQTCHRRFQQWVRLGVLRSILEVRAQALHDQGYLDLQEAFIDGSFAPVKQGGAPSARRSVARGRRSWPSPIVRDSRSPFTWRAPRHTKSHWCRPHSHSRLSICCRCVSSATTPTSRIGWTRNWGAVGWN